MYLPVSRVPAQIIEGARIFYGAGSEVLHDLFHVRFCPLYGQFVTRRDDADRMERKDVGQLPAGLVLLIQRFVARYEQAQRRSRTQQVPCGTRDVGVAQHCVLAGSAGLRFARTPQIGMPALRTAPLHRFHEQADRHSLLDVEHVLVLAAVRGALLLLGVAVQVEQEHAGEGLDQALAHAAKGRVVQVAVIGDEAEHASTGAVDRPLREAEKLHVVVVQPLGVAFVQRLAIDRKVALGLPCIT